MTSTQTARRYAASAFPDIDEVRLVPPGAPATLVNLSATGMLVESEARLGPGTELAVAFSGRFSPSSADARVIRCEVIGITASGALRYRIGLAFNSRIALPNETADKDAASPAATPAAPAATPAAPAPPPAAPAVAAAASRPLRNRW